MALFLLQTLRRIACSFAILFSITVQSADYFFEVGSALNPVSLGNSKNKQIELIKENIYPWYPSFTTGGF